MIIEQINEKTRIVLYRCWIPSLGATKVKLQRKVGMFWVKTSSIYTSCLSIITREYIKEWLLWDEANNQNSEINTVLKKLNNQP